MAGGKPGCPSPTLFIFSTTLEESLESPKFSQCGEILKSQGFLLAALDLPGHGQNRREGDSENALSVWRARMEKGDPVVPAFLAQASRVLDHLIAEGLADPLKVSACGTSRGGFMALHWMAAEARVQRVAAFAPVTHLLALREFDGAACHPTVNAMALVRQADRLAGRPIWICIGNHDLRVDTHEAVAFVRSVTAASLVRNVTADIELRIQPSLEHSILAGSHTEAAAWLLDRMRGGKPQMHPR